MPRHRTRYTPPTDTNDAVDRVEGDTEGLCDRPRHPTLEVEWAIPSFRSREYVPTMTGQEHDNPRLTTVWVSSMGDERDPQPRPHVTGTPAPCTQRCASRCLIQRCRRFLSQDRRVYTRKVGDGRLSRAERNWACFFAFPWAVRVTCWWCASSKFNI